MKRISINVGDDEDFHRKLRIAAAIAGESMGDFVKKAVEDRIKREQGERK